ncbi:hypothetical protein KSS87_022389 [Heliosperma pusillum]|nr:hypothetical protein KSS87_022389 [Heliosperma pusillum]
MAIIQSTAPRGLAHCAFPYLDVRLSKSSNGDPPKTLELSVRFILFSPPSQLDELCSQIQDDALETGELDYNTGALVRYMVARNILGLPATKYAIAIDSLTPLLVVLSIAQVAINRNDESVPKQNDETEVMPMAIAYLGRMLSSVTDQTTTTSPTSIVEDKSNDETGEHISKHVKVKLDSAAQSHIEKHRYTRNQTLKL